MEELETETELEINRILINGVDIGKFSDGGRVITISRPGRVPSRRSNCCKG